MRTSRSECGHDTAGAWILATPRRATAAVWRARLLMVDWAGLKPRREHRSGDGHAARWGTGGGASGAPASEIGAPHSWRRGPFAGVWPLLAVAATAFGVKAIVLAHLGSHPLLQPLGELDTAFYVELGRKVASGGVLAVTESFFVAPLYVYFLAVIFALGGTIETVRFVQIVLGTSAVGFIYVAARHWFGSAAALIAAVLAELTGLFTFYEILILPAALDSFLVAITLACVTLARRRSHWWPWAAAGLTSGLFVLNRPNALLYAVVLAMWPALLWWRARCRRTPGPRAVHLLALPAALLIVIGANAFRNHAVSGEWVLVSSHGGLNFYIGNGPDADGTYSRIPGITPSIAGQARDAKRMAEMATGRELSAGAVSAYFYRRAWAWIVDHPAAGVRLWIRKVSLLLNRVNAPLNFSYAYYSEQSAVLRVLVVGPWLLLPIGLAGLLLGQARRVRDGYWMWASFVPLYGVSVVAFFVSSRYRMPLLVPLCVTAAGALAWGWEQVRARRVKVLLWPAVAAAGVAAIVHWPLGLDDGRGFEQTRQAVWFIEQGRFDEARDYVARVARVHKRPGLLHYRVGLALAGAGRFDEAIPQFQRSMELDATQLATRLELGQALVVTGRAGEAVSHLSAAAHGGERVEVAAPWLIRALAASGNRQRAIALIGTWPQTIAESRPETALDLGTMALELGSPPASERWLRLATSRLPASAEAHENLGVALLLQERVHESIASLEAARRLDARRTSARLNLAAAYARAGRVADARAEAGEAQRLDPTEPRAAALLKALGGR
ncbi:MAG: glycosyltransferase family 39 protein [Acidobacteriota bacterium]